MPKWGCDIEKPCSENSVDGTSRVLKLLSAFHGQDIGKASSIRMLLLASTLHKSMYFTSFDRYSSIPLVSYESYATCVLERLERLQHCKVPYTAHPGTPGPSLLRHPSSLKPKQWRQKNTEMINHTIRDCLQHRYRYKIDIKYDIM